MEYKNSECSHLVTPKSHGAVFSVKQRWLPLGFKSAYSIHHKIKRMLINHIFIRCIHCREPTTWTANNCLPWAVREWLNMKTNFPINLFLLWKKYVKHCWNQTFLSYIRGPWKFWLPEKKSTNLKTSNVIQNDEYRTKKELVETNESTTSSVYSPKKLILQDGLDRFHWESEQYVQKILTSNLLIAL